MTPPFTLADRGGANSYTGLTLRFFGKSKSYIVNKKINGKTLTRKVGDYHEISHTIARDRARFLVEQIRDGKDRSNNR